MAFCGVPGMGSKERVPEMSPVKEKFLTFNIEAHHGMESRKITLKNVWGFILLAKNKEGCQQNSIAFIFWQAKQFILAAGLAGGNPQHLLAQPISKAVEMSTRVHQKK